MKIKIESLVSAIVLIGLSAAGQPLDARAFGAVNSPSLTSLTDATAAISNAIAALPYGGSVYLPTGIVACNLVITNSAIDVGGMASSINAYDYIGSGQGTILVPYDPTKPVITVGTDQGGVYGVHLHDISFGANPLSAPSNGWIGLKIGGGTCHSSIDRCAFNCFLTNVIVGGAKTSQVAVVNFNDCRIRCCAGNIYGWAVVQNTNNPSGAGQTDHITWNGGHIWNAPDLTSGQAVYVQDVLAYMCNCKMEAGGSGHGIWLDHKQGTNGPGGLSGGFLTCANCELDGLQSTNVSVRVWGVGDHPGSYYLRGSIAVTGASQFSDPLNTVVPWGMAEGDPGAPKVGPTFFGPISFSAGAITNATYVTAMLQPLTNGVMQWFGSELDFDFPGGIAILPPESAPGAYPGALTIEGTNGVLNWSGGSSGNIGSWLYSPSNGQLTLGGNGFTSTANSNTFQGPVYGANQINTGDIQAASFTVATNAGITFQGSYGNSTMDGQYGCERHFPAQYGAVYYMPAGGGLMIKNSYTTTTATINADGGGLVLNGAYITDAGAIHSDGAGNLTVKSLIQTSDREAKEHFQPLDALAGDVLRKVAALPVSQWNFRGEKRDHVGPMAQEFYAQFGLGDGHGITVGDSEGVTLLAVKGLYQRTQLQVRVIWALIGAIGLLALLAAHHHKRIIRLSAKPFIERQPPNRSPAALPPNAE